MGTTNNTEEEVIAVYHQLLQNWNARNAAGMAALVAANGDMVGFDGSQMKGPAEIEASLKPIFAGHPTAAYISKVREVRLLAENVAMLRAVVGMVPPGKNDINPAVNAIQILVVSKQAGEWKIESFQ